jgi:AcrR family transcriptional regulator
MELAMNHVDSPADSTRQQILRAAEREFARRPYSVVSLDDIIARAGVSKGAMYFHFQSKLALAMTIVDEQCEQVRVWFTQRLSYRLSGLESLVETTYFLGTQDIHSVGIRAGLNLLEQIGRRDGVQAKVFMQWSPAITAMVQRGIADGDIDDNTRVDGVTRLLIMVYLGLRRTADLDSPQEFFADLESAWLLTMPGFTNSERLPYFMQFVKRCTSVAKNTAAPPTDAE